MQGILLIRRRDVCNKYLDTRGQPHRALRIQKVQSVRAMRYGIKSALLLDVF